MRREKQAFLAAIAAAALTLPALALAQDGRGYFGLSIGPSKAKHWCGSELPPGAALAACDPRGKGWKMFAGYRINRVFSFEGSFIDFDKASLTATSGTETTTVSQGNRLECRRGRDHSTVEPRGLRQSRDREGQGGEPRGQPFRNHLQAWQE